MASLLASLQWRPCGEVGGLGIPKCNSGSIRRASLGCGGRKCVIVSMGFKIKESYDSSFELDAERDSMLKNLLRSQVFCKQVAEEAGISEAGVEFTGELFQPVPWSPTTQHGMPEELNKYFLDKDNYVIINVPPNYMFKAKVFNPSRLCAIYRKIAAGTTE